MYFRNQKQAQILTIEDDFARLVDVLDNGDLEFEFTYSLQQSDVVKYNAQKVNINVEIRNIVPKPMLATSHRGLVDTRALVDNIRSAVSDAKSTLQTQQTYNIVSRVSDITKVINPDVYPQLRARAPNSEIPSFNSPRLSLVPADSVKQSNDPQPILHRVALSAIVPDLQTTLSTSQGEIAQSLMHEMITRQSLDPTYVLQMTPRAIPEDATHGGLSNPSTAIEHFTDPVSRLTNFYLFPPASDVPPTTTDGIVDTDLVHVLRTVTDGTAEVTETVILPNSRLYAEGAFVGQIYVTFALADPVSNLGIDTIVKTIDLTQHLHVFYTPRQAPKVKLAGSPGASRMNLEVKQIDPGATEVQIYKKAFWVASTLTDDYTLIGTYSLTARDQSLLIQVDAPVRSPVLYRVIPVGKQSMQGFEFTNIVARPPHYCPVLAVALVAAQVDTGIQLEVRHLPQNAVAVMFLRWNTTTHDSEFTIAPVTTQENPVTTYYTDTPNLSNVGFIDDSVRKADLLTTIDTEVTDGNVYRYVARVIYKDGMTNDCGDATIEFVQPAPGQVVTTLTNLVVAHDTVPNVTFDIVPSTVATDMDAIKHMLSNQGMTDFFASDVATQRDELADLISYRIDRVNLTTGVRESFGIVTDRSFDDDAAGKNLSVAPLTYGQTYRYELYPLLRAPETMFDAFVKAAVDPTTLKPYSFSPAKYLHPLTLSRGTLVTTDGAKKRTAKAAMEFGVVGAVATQEVSFDNDTANVTNATAVNFDRDTNIVSWQILGSLDQVDHFIIMKQIHNIRTIIGKTHAEFASGACQYIHPITRHDVGSLKYIIIPIYSDYRVGPEAQTNTLVVEAPIK